MDGRYEATVNWEEKANDLERGLSEGTIPATFLIDNASSRDWYQVMVNLSERARDPNRLRAMIRRILRPENIGKTKDNNKRNKGISILPLPYPILSKVIFPLPLGERVRVRSKLQYLQNFF